MQITIVDSKYMVVSDPLLIGHVIRKGVVKKIPRFSKIPRDIVNAKQILVLPLAKFALYSLNFGGD